MTKKIFALLIAVMMLMVLFSAVALAEDEADGGGPGDKEARAAARQLKWQERKAKIAEKKAQLEARKEAFFALKEQTKQEVAAQKALIKEMKALIIEQVHSINEMEPDERKTLKGQIKQLWKEVRDTQRYLWEVRRAAVESAHGILGKVEVVGSGVGADDLVKIDNLMDQL